MQHVELYSTGNGLQSELGIAVTGIKLDHACFTSKEAERDYI
jgi:hypothetical protein